MEYRQKERRIYEKKFWNQSGRIILRENRFHIGGCDRWRLNNGK